MSESMREEQVPLGGKIACMFVTLTGLSIIAICALRRVQDVKISLQLPLTFFLVVSVSNLYEAQLSSLNLTFSRYT